MIKVSPSMLACDFTKYGQEIEKITKAGAEYVHLDVMDGVFVPNISFGIPVLKDLNKYTDMPIDVHLMIEEPHRYIKQFAENGADYITIHVEAESDIDGTLDTIKSYGVIPALSVKPNTPAEAVFPYLEKLGMILVMSVEPGFGGQSFMPSAIEKVRILREECNRRGLTDMLIEVDGGINLETGKLVVDAGADVLVAGSSLFGATDPKQMIADFKNLA